MEADGMEDGGTADGCDRAGDPGAYAWLPDAGAARRGAGSGAAFAHTDSSVARGPVE
ncbi:hypothetical protein GCM10028815_21040 [Mariniluteicoccus flavus]